MEAEHHGMTTHRLSHLDAWAQNGWMALVQARIPLLLTLVLGLCVYGGFVFVPGMHIDDEVYAVYGFVDHDIALGRFIMAFIRAFILPGPFNGYFTALLAVGMLCCSAVTFACTLFRDQLARNVCATLCVVFPQFCYQMEFHLQEAIIPLGYLLSIGAFIPLPAIARARSALQACLLAASFVGLMVLAAGIYQPIIVFPACMSLFYALTMLLNGREIRPAFTLIGLTALLSGLALGVYYEAAHLVLRLTGVPSAGAYFVAQVGWLHLPFRTALHYVLHVPVEAAKGHNYYGEALYDASLLPLAFLAMRAIRAGLLRGGLILILSLILLCFPYILPLALAQGQAGRTFIIQGACFGGLWALGLQSLLKDSTLPLRRISAGLVVALFTLVGSHVASRLAFADYIQWQADTSVSTRIISDIYRKYPDFNENRTPVYFYGPYRRHNFWQHDHYDAFGQSFLAWDEGNTDRITAFMTISGLANLHPPDAPARPRLEDIARTLPVWPQPDAIQRRENALIIRLGTRP
ncbi:hypothetical protein AD947_05265 [Acetobacter tropicalis]|uniref:Glycosyltransferase RgtA/B/C/D-like domain-containing protein n=1 Tax=Acetobacter tropicalis TaxID=104102 RepID=A0A149U0C3_9PROT|nr:glucosyltransferase domain-containing protein [Acetobacter tropicalis]KXV58832.1 hypothetical protein AD947_05265 [Acetobacter tropicalis]